MEATNSIIVHEKRFFSKHTARVGGFIILILVVFLIKHAAFDADVNLWFGLIFSLILLFVGTVLIFATDVKIFNFDNRIFQNNVSVFGKNLITSEKKLPQKIALVHIAKRKIQWKRYFMAAIPFSTVILTCEIYLVTPDGLPRKLTSMEENKAKKFSSIIAEFYGVEWRLVDLSNRKFPTKNLDSCQRMRPQ